MSNYFLDGRKYKFRKTGEEVIVVEHHGEADKRRKTDWVSFIDKDFNEHFMEEGLNAYWDFDDPSRSLDDINEREERRVIDMHFCQFAGLAMQGLISKKSFPELDEDGCIGFITDLSVEYAQELCCKLYDVNLEELINKMKGK